MDGQCRGARRSGRRQEWLGRRRGCLCIYPATTSAAAAHASAHQSLCHLPHPPALQPAMDAFRLRKKFPEVSNDEMLDLINRFKYVRASCGTDIGAIA